MTSADEVYAPIANIAALPKDSIPALPYRRSIPKEARMNIPPILIECKRKFSRRRMGTAMTTKGTIVHQVRRNLVSIRL